VNPIDSAISILPNLRYLCVLVFVRVFFSPFPRHRVFDRTIILKSIQQSFYDEGLPVIEISKHFDLVFPFFFLITYLVWVDFSFFYHAEGTLIR
jgi:hypothetical protein